MLLLQPPSFFCPACRRRRRASTSSGWDDLAARTVAGAYHVHTTRSDGTAIATRSRRRRARAGLTFVILTDHGDGTRPPDPPRTSTACSCSTPSRSAPIEGHYVALDMPRAPYPLGGAADAVVEDVRAARRVSASPRIRTRRKPALRWTDAARADRRPRVAERRQRVARRIARGARRARGSRTSCVRGRRSRRCSIGRPPSSAGTSSRDRGGSSRSRGADAHGGPAARRGSRAHNLAGAIGIPSYEASFATFSNRVVLEAPLSGDAAADARAIYAAIRRGSVFTAIDALARPALLDFRRDGDAIVARVAAPPGAIVLLLRDGQEVALRLPAFDTAPAGHPGHTAPKCDCLERRERRRFPGWSRT